jgi:hypothetical protein
MIKFFCGFISGFLLKDKTTCLVQNTFVNAVKLYHHVKKNKVPEKEKMKIFLVCKINDQNEFDEIFPKLKNKSASRVQPMWDYYEQKGVIKIDLEEKINESIYYKDFLNKLDETYDIPFFQGFSELFIYVHYTIENKEYINVYDQNCFIDMNDFKLNNTELSKKYNNIICATINYNQKMEYITKYFKMFLNNKIDITPELILLHYDNLDIHLSNNTNLQIVNSKIINISSLNEVI